MKTETENLLPKIIAGTVHTQFIRCGKRNCKCSSGSLHGPYFYHFARVNGRLRKRYLKASEAGEIKKRCALRQQMEKEQREDDGTVWQLLRQIRESIRETRNLYVLREKTDDIEK